MNTEETGKARRSLSRRISRRFINGLILLVPLAITFFVIEETLHFTEGVLGKHLPFYFPGMGIATLLLVIYLAGWASSYWATRRLIHIGEQLLGKIPVVKFIYNSVKHLSTAVFFFFNASAPTEIYPLSLHDALPISLSLLKLVVATGIEPVTPSL